MFLHVYVILFTGSLSKEVFVQGVLGPEVSVQGGLCPGRSVQQGVSVQGGRFLSGISPLYGKERAVRILLECFLVLRDVLSCHT